MECLMQIGGTTADKDDEQSWYRQEYDAFCDRLEQDMYPYILSY